MTAESVMLLVGLLLALLLCRKPRGAYSAPVMARQVELSAAAAFTHAGLTSRGVMFAQGRAVQVPKKS
jgi:hypothetical protein